MIYVMYLLVATAVTLLSIKAADYVDWIDKKTSLSGAFIGGIMLSAVTSLPEVFTSLSSTLLLDEPGLCIGNILGSDLFNLLVLSSLVLVYSRGFSQAKTSAGHQVVLLTVIAGYCAITLNMLGILNFDLFTVSITSILLVVCYMISIKFLSGEEGDASEDADEIPLTLKQIIFRFVLVSIGIVVLSILISQTTDIISDRLNLGKGLAGALFMGIATSLPELSSTISLFRKKNYDIAVGNIVGSNIFNLIILALADLLYTGSGIYDFSDPKTVNLLVFGFIAMPLALLSLRLKNRYAKMVLSAGVVVCYFAFLLV